MSTGFTWELRKASRLISELKTSLKNLHMTEEARQVEIVGAALTKVTEIVRLLNLALMGNPLTAALIGAMLAAEFITSTVKPTDVTRVIQFNVGASDPNERGRSP